MTEILKVQKERRASELTPPFSSGDSERVLKELDQLLESRFFKMSRRSSSFLSLIVGEALKGNVENLKERFLGARLFDRRIDYDTNADPVVRVTAGEVRKRLTQYYEVSQRSIIRIVLPVGNYVPKFEVLDDPLRMTEIHNGIEPEEFVLAAETPAQQNSLQLLQPVADTHSYGRRPFQITLFATIGVALIAAVSFYAWKERTAAKASQATESSTAFAVFWKPFVTSHADSIVAFDEFTSRPGHDPFGAIGTPNGGSSGEAASLGVSGVGEVMGMHVLDEDFKTLRLNLRAKRGAFFDFDDAEGKNLIFLGFPASNQALNELQTTDDFVFRTIRLESGRTALAILNNRPGPGESKQYLSAPEKLPTESDYAVIALIPGTDSVRHILLLAGITTFGTQGAAEFVSREESLKTLLPRIKTSNTGEIGPFEALIKVTIKHGIPVQEQIVAVHQK